MPDIRFFPNGYLTEHKYSVILACHEQGWLLSQHKDRMTWETPGGHIEPGESPLQAARRELFEETGALDFDIRPIFDYSVLAPGMVFLAQVRRLGPLPAGSEMRRTRVFHTLPQAECWTYPHIQPPMLAHYEALFHAPKPPFLYHGSPLLLERLSPQQAVGHALENGEESGVYAYETARQCIPFALALDRADLYVDDMTQEITLFGGGYYPERPGYLYKLDSASFERLDEIQWISKEPVTPLEVTRLRSGDYASLLHGPDGRPLEPATVDGETIMK